MENKIRVNAEKERVLRLSIPSDNGIIVINELSLNTRNDLVKEIAMAITENKEIDEKAILRKMIDECTNVEFDKDLFEVEYLSHEAQMISNELIIMFQEIIGEAYQVLKLTLQQAKNEMLQNEILKEKDEIAENIHRIEEETEKVEEEIKEEKVEKIEVRKPKRSRGKIRR